ncbi:MAG TPA: TPM domain-containing protein [Lysobacter sp.]|nr:TPM domain-containing protein [Lysobacter sp.]
MPNAFSLRAARFALLLCALLFACNGAETKSLPVDDRAGLLTPAEETKLVEWHAVLLAQFDIDYRVLTVSSTDDLSRLAVRSFETAAVGGMSDTGRGLLLVIDAGGQRVRLEVARQLEGVFVDSFIAYIEREQMVPFFSAGRVGDGIVAASELIAGRAEQSLAAGALDDRAVAATSAGGGAEADAMLDGGLDRPIASFETDTAAAEEPGDTVAAYLAAMAAHNADAALDLYSPASKEMLAGHVVTRAQMDNVVRTYRDCPHPELLQQDEIAVLRYPPQAPGCAPWLLERGPDGGWRLDFVVMQRAFRFDTRNHWRVAEPAALDHYGFAFEQ